MSSVTIYVDLKNVPHAFIGLTNNNGITEYFGFAPDAAHEGYPIAPGKLGQTLDPNSEENAGRINEACWSKTIQVSDDQLNAMRK